MSVRIDDKMTPVTAEELFVALWRAWINMFDCPPTKDSIMLMVSQWAFETGWGQSMHCFNLGNAKSKDGDGRDFCFFECGEELPVAEAEKWVAAAPTLVTIKHVYVVKGVTQASVHVKPDHPAARFRAYSTLEEGAADYLAMLRRNFAVAWPSLQAGDPVGFVRAVKQAGYFTGSGSIYEAGVRSIFLRLHTTLKIDTDSLPVLSDEHARRVMDLVALNLQESVDEMPKGETEKEDE